MPNKHGLTSSSNALMSAQGSCETILKHIIHDFYKRANQNNGFLPSFHDDIWRFCRCQRWA
ncbi:MAG TPA: hypothetical protein PKH92_10090, partial [Anaerolineaceae bacterium]|nr:hypothetical protein [Anaerolineaceae bacterium]